MIISFNCKGGVIMKKYTVEYMDNGINYTIKTFTDFIMAMDFYNRIRRKEWARLS